MHNYKIQVYHACPQYLLPTGAEKASDYHSVYIHEGDAVPIGLQKLLTTQTGKRRTKLTPFQSEKSIEGLAIHLNEKHPAKNGNFVKCGTNPGYAAGSVKRNLLPNLIKLVEKDLAINS
ncbi:MAG: hypothetical protein ABIC95_04995 [archaeon]